MWVELSTKSGARSNSETHASYNISKKGSATLRINMGGIQFLKKNRIKLIENDRVKLFFDSDTGKIGFLRDSEGGFRLSRNHPKNETLRINAADLKNHMKENKVFKFELSDELDVVLVPVDLK